MYGYNQQMNIDRINNQIHELERIKSNYQNPPQQPMNVFNVGNTSQIDFEARILNDNEKPDEILVQRKTAFIDLKKGQLSIKELNGEITSYKIELPKDEKDLKIEELERKLKEYESINITTNSEKQQPRSNDTKPSKDKS